MKHKELINTLVKLVESTGRYKNVAVVFSSEISSYAWQKNISVRYRCHIMAASVNNITGTKCAEDLSSFINNAKNVNEVINYFIKELNEIKASSFVELEEEA